MEGLGDGSATAVAPLVKWRSDFSRAFQYYLDLSTPHPVQRWLGTAVAAAIYILRVYYVQGFYVVSYGLGLYILNLLIGFLLSKVDPELENSDGASLPTRGSDEFNYFVLRVPEFKFWYSITIAFCVAFLMTFFSLFDVPVFWPILFCYGMVLLFLTMKHQIMHMIKYNYIPSDLGKQMSVDSQSEPKPSQVSIKKFSSESSACPPFQDRKEKMDDRIAALHQIVAPFGKRDTTSVLIEAIGYIKFLQNQIQARVVHIDCCIESRQDLKSRGLCLVPLSCMSNVINESGAGHPQSAMMHLQMA